MVCHKKKNFQSESIDAAVNDITKVGLAGSDILNRKMKALAWHCRKSIAQGAWVSGEEV